MSGSQQQGENVHQQKVPTSTEGRGCELDTCISSAVRQLQDKPDMVDLTVTERFREKGAEKPGIKRC